MPNWVSNIVKCDNSDALHQLRDFNLIIPEHPAIALLSGLAAQHAAQLYQQGKSWQEAAADAEFVAHLAREQKDIPVKHRLTPTRAARRYRLHFKLHGFVDWYDWRCAKWGTKWNVCHYRHQGGEVWFETAWSHPWPVLEALSRQFPDCVLTVSYADEDIGSNAGAYDMKGGKLLAGGEFEDGSREAYEMAFSHWGCAEDYVLRDDGYHYIDNDGDDDSGDHIAAPASPKLYLTSALDNGAGGH